MSVEFGAALDGAEQVQRDAIAAAESAAREALAALKPFDTHDGRILPGIARAVADQRKRLEDVISQLAGIVAEHLDAKPKPDATPIESAVDHEHAERVKAARPAA